MTGDSYQHGFKAGYSAAKQFYGLAARERLERIQRATEELQADRLGRSDLTRGTQCFTRLGT